MRHLPLLELLLRLGVAAAAGLALGVERELRSHPAGVRTHALVAVGAALFTVAGAYGFADLPRGANIDPARIAAQVASGIGFLGAGAILRQGLGVRGLTTAATLWLAAALGVASGAGGYAAVVIGTVVVLLVLVALRMAKPLFVRFGVPVTLIELEYERGHGTLGPLLRALNGSHSRVEHVDVVDDNEDVADGLRRVSLHVATREMDEVNEAIDAVRERPEVQAVRVNPPNSQVA